MVLSSLRTVTWYKPIVFSSGKLNSVKSKRFFIAFSNTNSPRVSSSNNCAVIHRNISELFVSSKERQKQNNFT